MVPAEIHPNELHHSMTAWGQQSNWKREAVSRSTLRTKGDTTSLLQKGCDDPTGNHHLRANATGEGLFRRFTCNPSVSCSHYEPDFATDFLPSCCFVFFLCTDICTYFYSISHESISQLVPLILHLKTSSPSEHPVKSFTGEAEMAK